MPVHSARICYNLVAVLRDIIPASHCWEVETMSWKYTHSLISKLPSTGTLLKYFPYESKSQSQEDCCLVPL